MDCARSNLAFSSVEFPDSKVVRMSALRFMLIAGEPSGDSLAAEFVQAFRQLPQVRAMPWPPEFFGAGGPRMSETGVELEIDLTAHAVFGISDVLSQYFKFKGFFVRLFRLALDRRPDAIILVDFGGFNLRFAEAIKRCVRSRVSAFSNWNPKIIHYVSPQVWASRAGRAYQLARNADLLLSIFPFEKAWYAGRVPQLRVEFVGHPMVDRYVNAESGGTSENRRGVVSERSGSPHPNPLPRGEGTQSSSDPLIEPARLVEARKSTLPLPKGQGRGEGKGHAFTAAASWESSTRQARNVTDSHPLILLLPGSRKREIEAHLPGMVGAVQQIKASRPIRLRMVLPNPELAEFASSIVRLPQWLEVRTQGLAESLTEADLAIASSGTVTLECAYFHVPTVVLYKTSRLTYEIAKRIITVKHIAMPNLLAGEMVYPELIQGDVTAEAIAGAALAFLNDPARVAGLKPKLTKVVESLGRPGASTRAAEAVLKVIRNPS